MSGSLDLQSVKTRQLILQNPDGSFPATGGILAIVDSLGRVGTVSDMSVATVTVDTINITGAILQDNITVAEVQALTLGRAATADVSGLLTAGDISATNVNMIYLAASDVSSGPIVTGTLDTATLYSPYLEITDLSASTMKATQSTVVQNLVGTNASLQDLTTNSLEVGNTASTDNLDVYNLNATHSTFTSLTSEIANCSTLISGSIKSNTLDTQTATIETDVSTNNLAVAGTFVFNQLNLDTVIVNGTLSSSRSINTNTIEANTTTVGDLSAELYSVTRLNVKNLYNVNALNADTSTVTNIQTQRVNTGGISATGRTVLNKLSANTLFAAGATVADVSATNMYIQTMNATTDISLNGGGLTYAPPSTLLVNSVPTTRTQALAQQPYYPTYVYNDLATTTDISNTLLDLINSFNDFVYIFSERAIAVNQYYPRYTINSDLTIQFTVLGVTKPPVYFLPGSYTILDIVNRLNAVSPVIQFNALPPVLLTKPGWQIKIVVTGGGNNTYIGDVTSVPTGSLQMLRYLGFVINDISNSFQTYTFSEGGAESTTLYNIYGSYISTDHIGFVTNNPNILPAPIYDVSSSDPYALTFIINNAVNSQAKYICINIANEYLLYEATTTIMTVYGLSSYTSYQVSIFYLDNYNRSATSTKTVTTPRIPAPTVTSSSTFNSITLSWAQPYSGLTYQFHIDASGQYIVQAPNILTTTSYTYTNLLRNTPYSFNVYSIDISNNSRSVATPVAVSTTNYAVAQAFNIVYQPGYTTAQHTNIPIGISWDSGPPSGSPNATGTLKYKINSGSTRTASISTGLNQYLTSDLSGVVGDISCTLIYTDNSYNTVTYTSVSPVVPSGLISYTNSFGFSKPPGFTGTYPTDVSANASSPLVLDNVNILGLGYLPIAAPGGIGGSPSMDMWRENTFNSVAFYKGIRNTTANPVTFVANVYYMPISDYYANGFSPKNYFYQNPYTYSNVSLNLAGGYPIAAQSAPYTLAGNTSTTTATLQFPSTLTFTESTLVVFQITSGSGNVQFATYDYIYNGATAYKFTALKLTNANSLVNTFLPTSTGVGIVCNFNLV